LRRRTRTVSKKAVSEPEEEVVPIEADVPPIPLPHAFKKGKTNIGRKGKSPRTGDQWARADKILESV